MRVICYNSVMVIGMTDVFRQPLIVCSVGGQSVTTSAMRLNFTSSHHMKILTIDI